MSTISSVLISQTRAVCTIWTSCSIQHWRVTKYNTIHTLALYVDFSTVELNSQTPSFGSRTLRIWNHSLSDIYLTKKDKRKIKAWSQKTFLGLEVVLCGVSITLKLISRLKLLRLSVISWYPGVWRTVAFFAFLPFFLNIRSEKRSSVRYKWKCCWKKKPFV